MADEANPNQVRENEPADLGYAPPDPGQGESATSEVPEGVDALTEEQKQAAQERGGGDDGDDGGAIDVSAVMQGDDDAGEADASAEADADAEGTAADDAGDNAVEKTDVEAQVAPDTGEAS